MTAWRLGWSLSLACALVGCGGSVTDTARGVPEGRGGVDAGVPVTFGVGGGAAGSGGASLGGGPTRPPFGAGGAHSMVDGGRAEMGDAATDAGAPDDVSTVPEGGAGVDAGPRPRDAAADARSSLCPATPPSPVTQRTCDSDGLTCGWGTECCDSGCFDSTVCYCAVTRWICYATDACLGQP